MGQERMGSHKLVSLEFGSCEYLTTLNLSFCCCEMSREVSEEDHLFCFHVSLQQSIERSKDKEVSPGFLKCEVLG